MRIIQQIVDAAEEVDRQERRHGDIAFLRAFHTLQVERHTHRLTGFDVLQDGVATLGIRHTDRHQRR